MLFVEGKKEDTAYTCSNCRKYLVTSAQSGDFRQIPADLIAISLTHLDLILQEKGFMPMAECEGNSLRDSLRGGGLRLISAVFLTGWPDHGRPIPARLFTGRAAYSQGSILTAQDLYSGVPVIGSRWLEVRILVSTFW